MMTNNSTGSMAFTLSSPHTMIPKTVCAKQVMKAAQTIPTIRIAIFSAQIVWRLVASPEYSASGQIRSAWGKDNAGQNRCGWLLRFKNQPTKRTATHKSWNCIDRGRQVSTPPPTLSQLILTLMACGADKNDSNNSSILDQ
jgi:hypothetical protein